MSTTRLRIAELASHADVSVDTIRFYQKRGLLPPPDREGRVGWYSDQHVERLEEIRQLQEHGLPLAVIGTLDQHESPSPMRAALARAMRSGGSRVSLAAAERQTGMDHSVLQAIAEAGVLGSVDEHGAITFDATDLETLEAGSAFIAAGVPIDALLEIGMAYDQVVREVAARCAQLFDVHVRTAVRESVAEAPSSGGNHEGDDPAAKELAARFERLLDISERVVASHFRSALLQAATARVTSTEIAPITENQ